MARLTAPLFSLGASGTIADALTFASWKGVDYVRTRVIPANPNTANQQEVRGVFSTLSEMWKRMPAIARAPWQAAVRGSPLTDRNRHVQANAAALKGQSDLNALVMSVSSGSSIPPINVVASDGTGQVLNIVAETPTPPIGYTLTAIQAAAVLDGDPSPVLIRTTIDGEDESTPFSIDLDVGEAGTYQWGCWCKWTRDADSIIFYSAAVRGQQAIA